MKLPGWSYKEKVLEIFREMAGDRAYQTLGFILPEEAFRVIGLALAKEYTPEVAEQIAIHLTDWNSDAAFIVALILFPKRFTKNEIRRGVAQFLIHAPDHIAAAAKLGGWPITDCFEVGALDGREDD